MAQSEEKNKFPETDPKETEVYEWSEKNLEIHNLKNTID